MLNAWQFRLTPPQFHFFLVLWTISMTGISLAAIFAIGHLVTHAIVFPEYIGFNLTTLLWIGRLMFGACCPLTLLMFYLKYFGVRLSLKWLRILFVAQGFIWLSISIFPLAQENTRGEEFLVLYC